MSRSEVEQAAQAAADAQRLAVEAQKQAIIAALPPRERAFVAFLSLLSADAFRAAYRKAALELHPDRQGGDAERMSKLNAAWSELEKELKP